MTIAHLNIRHIRNLQDIALKPCQHINIVSGQNGSGKTSLLEAIHFLGLTRSFRTSQFRHLVTAGEPNAVVHGHYAGDKEDAREIPFGVERRLDGDVRMRFGGQDIDLSTLATYMPLQVLDTETFQLLEGSPGVRRQFLDWGVFHADKAFIQLWRGFKRVLKQRNSLLKCGRIDPRLREVWDREFISFSEQITRLRSEYLELLRPDFEQTLKHLLGDVEVELKFSPGWDMKRGLDEVLAEGFQRDLKQGYTAAGPQRADLRVKADGFNAAERLSRGQKKLVVSALKLAQGALFHRLNGRPCIYLIDDLPSELDQRHCQMFCQFLEQSSNQCFITCVDPEALSGFWLDQTEVRYYRIEAGQLTMAD